MIKMNFVSDNFQNHTNQPFTYYQQSKSNYSYQNFILVEIIITVDINNVHLLIFLMENNVDFKDFFMLFFYPLKQH